MERTLFCNLLNGGTGLDWDVNKAGRHRGKGFRGHRRCFLKGDSDMKSYIADGRLNKTRVALGLN